MGEKKIFIYEDNKGGTAGVGGHKGDGVFVPDVSVSDRPYAAPAAKYNPVPSAMGVTFDACLQVCGIVVELLRAIV